MFFVFQGKGGRDGRRFWLGSDETMSFLTHRLHFLPEPLHQVVFKQAGILFSPTNF